MDALQQFLDSVQTRHESATDPRYRQLVLGLLSHLFAYAREVRLTRKEWLAGIAFLNSVGRASQAGRDEFMLLSDVIGFSSLMDLLDQIPGSTEGTVLGPFYQRDSPRRDNGGSLIDQNDGGDRLTVEGTIRSLEGGPIAGAEVDVWSCASNGLYPAQDPAQPPNNMRGMVTADDQGRYAFTVVRPTNYSVPTDGPVGDFLRLCHRPSRRAAHVHMVVSAPGYESVTTHLFDDACPYLKVDAVFSVRQSLIRHFEPAGEHAWRTHFDIRLAAIPGKF